MFFRKVYRAFPELDHLTDAECGRYVRDAWLNTPVWVCRLPRLSGLAAGVAWATAWITLDALTTIDRWVPLPRMPEMRLALLIATTGLFGIAAARVIRTLLLWRGIRREVRRSCCPKCGQSLTGLPIQTRGVNNDPADQFIRCPECGRTFCLLDIGLTPRDLVPFEQRAASGNIGRPKPGTPRTL